ncbi:MAG: HEPN domain-containing protein [Candidatus Omnitrophota bacterium]
MASLEQYKIYVTMHYIMTQSPSQGMTSANGQQLNEAVRLNKDLDKFREYCLILDRYYAATRYPDALPGSLLEGLPSKGKAEAAVKYAREFFDFIKERICEV